MSTYNVTLTELSEVVFGRGEFMRKCLTKNVSHIRHLNLFEGHRIKAVTTLDNICDERMKHSNMIRKGRNFGTLRLSPEGVIGGSIVEAMAGDEQNSVKNRVTYVL